MLSYMVNELGIPDILDYKVSLSSNIMPCISGLAPFVAQSTSPRPAASHTLYSRTSSRLPAHSLRSTASVNSLKIAVHKSKQEKKRHPGIISVSDRGPKSSPRGYTRKEGLEHTETDNPHISTTLNSSSIASRILSCMRIFTLSLQTTWFPPILCL
ncbi:hypothetical protein M431DRAFT_201096 [Trichoderma harzianum CBS 226.95]|uniref:Uncharacterized protein n=1 Tax=Trichoderma harzianum CBS 226.95 TaxID=983964 RepID=A0A2T4AV72_TRIHA|nr:hypothetical protein M431DRAFT_201096 [Trichoderma harzianum CBS 226.95]PTB60964.1 hypothetical protein M431DRAFT_201096 [Trichoderma harzianum CBS 226.95]